MNAKYEIQVKVNPTLVSRDVYRKGYQVVESIELLLDNGECLENRLHVTLTDESLVALNNKSFDKLKLDYCYKLYDVQEDVVIDWGRVYRSISFESGYHGRLTSMYNLQTIVSELLHETLASMALCNAVQLNNQSPAFKFFCAARRITPFALGVSKSSPIVSSRFWVVIPTDIPGMHAKRRFIPDVAKDGHVDMLGVYTVWTYEPQHVSHPTRLTYTDQAITVSGSDSTTSELTHITITPMTAEEVIAHMRTTSLPPSQPQQ